MLHESAISASDLLAGTDADKQSGASPPGAVAALAIVNAQRSAGSMTPATALAAFTMTLDRLEQVIDLETRELRKNRVADLREFNQRKSQGLLELSRVMRSLGEAPVDEQLQLKLARLRTKLDTNLSVLRMHLTAAQEVSAVISRVIQDADSDGTYSALLYGRGRDSC